MRIALHVAASLSVSACLPSLGTACGFGWCLEGQSCIHVTPAEAICTSATTAGCGDGVVDVEAGEICDDGNNINGDGCSADCRSQEVCGNGIVDRAVGEQCDDGNTMDGDGCEHDCTLPSCGNGILDSGEQCDDGNHRDGDSCSRRCEFERCGNGVLDFDEQCDDGNNVDGDGCEHDCALPRGRLIGAIPSRQS